jgi:hypothetical protein
MVQLPVTLLPQCRSPASQHITQLMENFNVVLLVNSLTIWYILMVNDAFVIKENVNITSPYSKLGMPFLA